MYDKIIAIDTETTGVSVNDELLQLSIVGGSGEVLYDSYIRPVFLTEWPDAEAVNGISYDTVKDAPTPEEVAAVVAPIFANAETIVGYNTPFDIGFVERCLNVQLGHLARKDVMWQFADYMAATQGAPRKRHKLIDCAAFFGFEWPGGAHNSKNDALATLFCYQAMLAEGYK